jgi:two-component system, cell cycle response regulator DivK
MKTTVLIVEDNLFTIEICQDMFLDNEIPAELVVAQTGEESIQLAIDLQPALILMDLRLPGMDGVEVTQLLQSNPRTAHIPVWAMTAYVTPEDEQKARDAGCCGYYAKPFRPRIISEHIRSFLRSLAETPAPSCLSQRPQAVNA